jgi:hypothetical protein
MEHFTICWIKGAAWRVSEVGSEKTGPNTQSATPAWTDENVDDAYTPWLKIPARKLGRVAGPPKTCAVTSSIVPSMH